MHDAGQSRGRIVRRAATARNLLTVFALSVGLVLPAVTASPALAVIAPVAPAAAAAIPAPADPVSHRQRYARKSAVGFICAEVRRSRGRLLIDVWDTGGHAEFPTVDGGVLVRVRDWKPPIRWTVAAGRRGTQAEGHGFAIGRKRLVWSPYYGGSGSVPIPRIADTVADKHPCWGRSPVRAGR